MAKQQRARLAFMAVSLCVLFALFAGIALAGAPGPQVKLVAQQVTPVASEEPTPEGNEEAIPTPTAILEDVVATRTPAPTHTPGPLSQQVEEFAYRAGLARTKVLGLTVPDWINLAISLLWILVAYLVGTWLIRRLLPRLARRTPSTLDDKVLDAIGSSVRWLVVLGMVHFATVRLLFLSVPLKSLLTDLYFVLALFITVRVVWQIIDLSDTWYRERLADAQRTEELNPLLVLLVRVGRVILILIGVIVLLSHFGVNVTAFAAALGLGGLAFSLAARDTIADAIAGFTILVDRPFRLGDRIEIQEVGTWGDVVDIGLRTTRIRTRDNRLVIVPNSTIGSNQVINYTYPDPRYRIETHVGIAYGTDIERARQVLIDAVRKVPAVLLDRPVDALYIEMGNSAMIFRVRWWIESYEDTRRVVDQVHTMLQHALDEAGIESPFPTQAIQIQGDPLPSQDARISGSPGPLKEKD